MQNTLKNKAKFFASYLFQNVLFEDGESKFKVSEVIFKDEENLQIFKHGKPRTIGISFCKLCLKDTCLIEDDLAEKIATILHSTGIWNVSSANPKGILNLWDSNKKVNATLFRDLSFVGPEHEADYYHFPKVYDLVRQHGFALPWNGLSVETQVEYGWIELQKEI